MSALTAVVLALPAGGGHGGSKSGVFPLIIGIVFIVIGLLNATNPTLQWRMRSWQYKNREAQQPSDIALKITRVVGAVFAIIGVVLLITGITKL